MRKIQHALRYPLLLAAVLATGITACKKDNNDVISSTISDPGIAKGTDTLYVGETLTIRPKLSSTDNRNASYQWLVNGRVSGSDSVYTFKADERGDYTVSYQVINNGAQSKYYYRLNVLGKYENGALIVNEGWFGHEPGSVNFYAYGADTIVKKAFEKENPGKALGITTQHGAVFNGKLYLTSKQGAFVVADAYTLKETGRIATLPQDGRAFVGVDAGRGLISTLDGIYPVNLTSLALGAKVAGISGQVGGMITAGNYVFVHSETSGILALNKTNYSIAKNLGAARYGFTISKDGAVWAVAADSLIRIDPANLARTAVKIPFGTYNSWGAWNAGSLTASTTDNTLFFVKTGEWGGGTQVYRYVIGTPSSMNTPFITLPANNEFYGAGIRYNPKNNTLLLTGIKPGWGTNAQFNNLFVHNATTGASVKAVPYTGYFFPAIPVFN